MNKIKLATVFSGIGSVEFALKRLKIPYEIIFACDNGEVDVEYNQQKEFKEILKLKTTKDKHDYVEKLYDKLTNRTNFVKQTYLANYKCKKDLFFNDIKLLDGNDFKGKVDLFVGGSPCQSFSSVGSQAGLNDIRGTLFYEFARLINEIQPKVFIYENVRNLLNHDNGKTWKTISKIFGDLGYSFTYSILNASDFNIPQTRRRLFVVGFKNKEDLIKFKFPKPMKLKYAMQDFLIDNCDYGNFININKGKLSIKKCKGHVDNKYILTPCLYRYVMKSGTKNWYQKPEINLTIARTLLKTMGNHHRAGVDNYVSSDFSNDLGKVRILTEREALRLMGYTDDFKIVVSRSQIYKQAGNSIVVDVIINLIKGFVDNGVL